CMQALDFPLTS
nr:immunoglobulin light chain junction region [Macaca mulatta]